MLSESQLNQIKLNRKTLDDQLFLRQSTPDSAAYWVQLLQALKNSNTPFEIEYLYCTTDLTEIRNWTDALVEPPFNTLSLSNSHVKPVASHYIHKRVHELYPTVWGDHFQPVLTYHKYEVLPEHAASVLQETLAFTGLATQQLYVFYFDQPLVLKLNAAAFVKQAQAFLYPAEELCILSADLKKMVFRNRKNEWWWGVHFEYESLYRADATRYYVYWTCSGTPELDYIFSEAAPAMKAAYNEEDLLHAEDQFLESDADTACYLIRGAEIWIELLFEKHESYYGWHCYTYDRTLIEPWKAYFKALVEKSRKHDRD